MKKTIVFVMVSFLLLATEAVFARGKPPPPLAEQIVVYWTPGECAADAKWVGEVKHTEERGWERIEWGWFNNRRPLQGEACAHYLTMTPGLRACCVRDEERVCEEAIPAEFLTVAPAKILSLMIGTEFPDEQVAAWNAEHVCLPGTGELVNVSIHCDCLAPLVCAPDPETGKDVCKCGSPVVTP